MSSSEKMWKGRARIARWAKRLKRFFASAAVFCLVIFLVASAIFSDGDTAIVGAGWLLGGVVVFGVLAFICNWWQGNLESGSDGPY